MRHIAKENRCFVVGCCQVFHKTDIPDQLSFKEKYLKELNDCINPGQTLIVDPDGKIIAGPVDAEETILYADISKKDLIGPRWQLDIAGHYGRPDVFELRVHKRAAPFIQVIEKEPDKSALKDSILECRGDE